MAKKKRYELDPRRINTPWVYTQLDKDILKLLARYRFLRGTFIHALLDRPKQSANRSLMKLCHKGLLAKPRWQFLGWNSLNDTDIYEITAKGLDHLRDTIPEATNLIRGDETTKQTKHAMMICDTLASIEIGARGHASLITEGEILERVTHPNPLWLPYTVRHTFEDGHTENMTSHIRPDGTFAVRYENGKSRLFFVEAEHYSPVFRNTLGDASAIHKRTGKRTSGGNSSTLRKLLAYRNVRDAKVTWQQLRKHGFTVLFVFPTEHHTKRAVELATKLFGRTDLFLFQTVPVQEEILGAPKPFPGLFTGEWQRAGLPAVSIKEAPAE